MSFDTHSNFVSSLVATAPAPAASGTSLTVTAGDGAKFTGFPFNCTVSAGTIANAEIVRVTNVVGDVLTIVRAQESTAARTIVVGDQIAITITAKTLTDVEKAIPVKGSLALGSATQNGTVSGLGLAFTPSAAFAIIRRPAGGLNIWANVNSGTLSSDGFDFELSAQTDSASYVLDFLLIP